jgi:hypothetical protein
LNVISKASLADAFAVALRRTNRAVTKIKSGKLEEVRNNSASAADKVQ